MPKNEIGDWFRINQEDAAVEIYDHPLILSGICGGDANTPGWSLDLGKWDKSRGGDNVRRFTQSIIFSQPFQNKPCVTIAIQTFDIDVYTKTSVRVGVEAIAITREGFTASFYTWLDTVVYGVRANWMAIGSSKKGST